MCQKICSFMQHQREISRKNNLEIQNNMMRKMLFHLVTSPSVHTWSRRLVFICTRAVVSVVLYLVYIMTMSTMKLM